MRIVYDLYKLTRIFYRKLDIVFSSFFMQIFIKNSNVHAGRGVKFVGKTTILSATGSCMSIGSNCEFLSRSTANLIGINRPCILTTMNKNAKLIIGNKCGFSGTVIGCFKEITLGNNVRCGANTTITDGDWHLDDPRSGELRAVHIGDNVWLGINVTVLKGVTIGENTVIGAGSIVTKDIPANVVAAGNPCKVIKHLDI